PAAFARVGPRDAGGPGRPVAGVWHVGAVGAALVPAYRRDLESARRRLADPPVPVHRLSRPWGEIEYARYGDGPAVLILHGAGQGWDGGVDWAQRRLAAGADVLAVSRF